MVIGNSSEGRHECSGRLSGPNDPCDAMTILTYNISIALITFGAVLDTC